MGVERNLHLHIGPGRLGLGLIVPSGLEAGLEVLLVSHAGSEVDAGTALSVLVRGEEGERVLPLEIGDFAAVDEFTDLSERTQRRVLGADHLLLTISARSDAVRVRSAFLLDIAGARAGDSAKRTVFIPCENDPGPHYPDLKSSLENLGVDCRRTMVNRLCLKYSENHALSRQVIVDDLSEWVIEGDTGDSAVISALDGVDHVDVVPDIRPRETRKRWLVNGAHLAVAILAHERGIPSIDLEVSRKGRDRWIRALQESLARPLEERFPGLDDNKGYAARHVAAWMRHEDDVLRVLGRLKRSGLDEFFDDLERKLLEPVRALGGVVACPQVGVVLERLHKLLLLPESYVDFAEFDEPDFQLSEENDGSYRRRYREILEPVCGPKVARRRENSLREAFRDHREAYS